MSGIFFVGARFSGPQGVTRADGVYGVDDQGTADAEGTGRRLGERVGFSAEFIKTWKKIPIPPAFKD